MLIVPINSAYSNIGIQIDNKPVITSVRGNILYVGGNGSGNYTKIQDAIDNASKWDTVFVFNGTYYESIFISKSIQVIGENRYTTIIDGIGHEIVVEISTHDVLFEEFTVQSPTQDLKIGIIVSGSFVRIYNNTIKRAVKGIQIMNDCCRIFGNNFTKNVIGILINVGIVNVIHNNNFIENIVHAAFFCSFLNSWFHNYWDKGIVNNKKIIFGTIGYYINIPWIQTDLQPAKKPFDI